MPTVIEELVVKLGIDGSKFKADVDRTQGDIARVSRSAVQSGKNLEDSFRRTHAATGSILKQGVEVGRQSAQQFSRFRLEVAALFTTLATGFGLKNFLKDLANTEASTGRLATNLGMSVGELDMFQQAVIRNGGTAEDASQSLSNLVKMFEDIKLGGNPDSVAAFRSLGIAISDAGGKALPLLDVMDKAHDRLKNMSMPDAQAWGARMGFGPGTVTLLHQTDEAYQQFIDHVKSKGLLNEQDAAAGIKFNQTLADWDQSFRNLKVSLGNDLLPIFEEYINIVTKWLDDPKNKEFVKKEVHEDITKFIEGIMWVKNTMHEWHVTATDLAEYIGGVWILKMMLGLGPIGIAAAAIAATFIAIKKGMEGIELPNLAPDSPLWAGVSVEDQLKYPQSPESRKRAGTEGENPNPFHWWNPGSWANRPDHPGDPFASGDMNNVQRGFLDTIAGPESGGRYNIKNGGSSFSDFSQFPNGIGPGGTSTAAGRYQITKGTWDDLQKKYPGMLGDFSPKNQDAAAWILARDRYKTSTGGDLEDDLTAGKSAKVAAALNPTWPSLPGGSQSNRSQSDFDAALARNTAGQFSASKGAQENIINPVKEFWKKNFGTSAPDRALSKWSSPTSTRSPLSSGQSNTSTSETNINGPITINTQSKDADGIARDISSSLKKYSFVATANTGLA